jgi:hypothetical protein
MADMREVDPRQRAAARPGLSWIPRTRRKTVRGIWIVLLVLCILAIAWGLGWLALKYVTLD